MEKKILRASKSGKKPVVARLSIEHRENENVLTCDSLDGWADTATFVVYEADSVGNPIAGTETDWKGDVEGNKLINAKLTNGEDRDYPVGTILMACETAEGRNMLVEALGKSLNPDGTLKKIESAENMFAEGSIPGRAVKAEEIDASKINASELKTGEMFFKKESISGEAVKAGELKFPNGSIPMTALAGTSGDESQSQIYTDAEIAKVNEKLSALHNVARTGSYNDLENKPAVKKFVRAVIGCSSAGYRAEEVDYLCDGSNDQEEINQAINSLPENGGEITILDGIYNIGAPILIQNKNNVRLSGAGHATTLKRAWDSGETKQGVIEVKMSKNATVVNLFIDNNIAAYPSDNNVGLNADEVSSESLSTGENGGSGDFLLDEGGVKTVSDSNGLVTLVEDKIVLKKTYIVGNSESGDTEDAVDILYNPNVNRKDNVADIIANANKTGGAHFIFKRGEYVARKNSSAAISQNLKISGDGNVKFNLPNGGGFLSIGSASAEIRGVDFETRETGTNSLIYINESVDNFVLSDCKLINSARTSLGSVRNRADIAFAGKHCIIKNNKFKNFLVAVPSGHGSVKFKNNDFSYEGKGSLTTETSSSQKNILFYNNKEVNFAKESRVDYSRTPREFRFYSNKGKTVLSGVYSSTNYNDKDYRRFLIKNNEHVVMESGFWEHSVCNNCDIRIENNKSVDVYFTGESVFRKSEFVNNKRVNVFSAYISSGSGQNNLFFYRNDIYCSPYEKSEREADREWQTSSNITFIENRIFPMQAGLMGGSLIRFKYDQNPKVFSIRNEYYGRVEHVRQGSLSQDDTFYLLEQGTGFSYVSSDKFINPKYHYISNSKLIHDAIESKGIEEVKKNYPVGSLVQSKPISGSDGKYWTVVHYGDIKTKGGVTKPAIFLMSEVINDREREFDYAESSNPISARKNHGNNRYSLSNIHNWLNSSAERNWWSKSHEYDVSPSYSSGPGFAYKVGKEFTDYLAEIKITSAVPTVDGGGDEEVSCKFFLPSEKELGFEGAGLLPEGEKWEWFTGEASEIQKRRKNNRLILLRTHSQKNEHTVKSLHPDGGYTMEHTAVDRKYIMPACAIV